MTNAILREKTHAETPHAAPAARLGGTSRVDEGKPASAKPRRGALLCKKAVLWLVAAVLPAFAAAAVPSTEQSSTTVDILVAFDRNAAAYANRNGGVADFALTAVSKMNAALANNALDEHFRFRLVGTMEVDAEATDVHAALEAIRDSEAGWAAIKEKRDEVGGDIVTTLIDTGSAYGTTGASWPLTTGNYATFADSAYNVCAVRAVEIGHAMTREVGHNMGAGNATEVADPDIRGPQLHDYSSGYYFTGSDGTRYHTIMADSADGYGNTYALAPLFSSPTATWLGVAAGDETNDNARTLLSTCAYASNWRAQKVAMSYDVFVSPEPETLFDESISVTLMPGKDGLDIRYTTDGSEPTLTSGLYSKPLKLTRTTTVKAAAVYDGRLGPVYTAHYLKRDLATALNAPQLEWTTSPDDPWVAQSDDAFDGFAAKSCPEFVGNFGCGKTSWLKTTVTGPTEMGFRYQKTQYSSAFKVYCDSQVVWSDSETEAGIGGAGWHQAVVNLPEGTHEITFAFEQGYGSYNGFNGIVLDTVCFDAWSASPTIEPETTDDQATATVFTGSKTVTLTPPAGRTGTLFYTLDGSDPTQEGALPYTGPFTVDKSVFVQAVFVEPGRDASAPARGYFLERHPMKPGEWTTDVEGVKEASARDGRLIAVLMAHRADCDWTKAFMPVAESPEFLTWAEMNGVYLITADDSERVDTEAAKNYFRDLYSGQDAIFPTLVFADPSNPDVPLASGVARNDGVATIGGVPYDDTVESLVRGFAAVMGETFVPAAPTASPESELVAGFPVTVTLTNPNASGTIYYTLDGSAPTLEKGTRYAGPIKIVDKKAVLCAAVRLDSGLSGLVLIKSYKTGSDVVWTTLPTGMAGYGYVVSNLTATAEIRPDNGGRYALPIGAKVGIYAVAEEGYAIVGTNPYVIDEVTSDTAIDASALPTAQPSCVVTVGDHAHLAVAWTGGDGSVTNEVDGDSFPVPGGTTNVRVIFTAESDWEIVGDAVVDLGTVTSDITFGNAYKVPEVGFLVPYLDYDADAGTFTNAVRACTPVTSAMRTLAKGWYAVTNDVDFPKAGRLQVSSDARLILCDGASLTITNVSDRFSAVTVAQSKRFTIYGQTEGTGRLTVCGGELNAGIGGYSGNDSPDEFFSPDDCGTVTINGGTVVAQGGQGAAGIGNARQGRRCVVRITGGKVTARKGREISGRAADDIGYGECTGARQSGVTVEISGGVFANPLQNEWCRIHYVPVPNTDSGTCADYPYTVRRQCVVTVGGHPLRVNVAWTGDDGSATNEVAGESFDVPPGTMNLRVVFTPTVDLPLDGDAVVNLGTVTGDITFGDGNDYRIPRPYSPFGDIEYLDWNGSVLTNAVLSKYDYLPVTEATRELETGWYAVTNDVVFPQAAHLRVKGNARLVLCDGASLAITNGPVGFAAVEVNDGKSLTVYGQPGNTGALTARGSGGGAGIGGASETIPGKVTVFGGTVTAQGGDTNDDCGGAGIGGGYSRSGAVEIRGGRVTAHGGGHADDIGRGENSQNAAAVTISGGIFRKAPENGWLAPDRITVENPDEATKAAYPWTVVPQSCTVTVGNTPYMTVAWTSGDGTVTNVVENKTFSVPGGTGKVCVIFTAKPGGEIVGENVVDLGAVLSDIAFGSGSGYKLPSVRMLPVEYVDADGVVRVKAVGEFTRVTASTKKLADGKWYAVIGDVTLTNSLSVAGSAHLILCDWATLAITNRTADAAISVGSGASLTIYGQTADTGRLAVSGGNAGIGGKTSGVCGAIAIHGGTISASAMSNKYCAGIGSGALGSGGSVTITGGRITAQGGTGAEDIGSGANAKSPCEVSISGGVFARPVQDAWLAPGFAAVANEDELTKTEYPWAIVDRRVGVSPSNPLGPYATAAEATNAMAMAVFAPDEEVAEELTTQARARYERWFGLDVAERGASGWYVEAVLTDAAKSNLAETAAAATRQIPVAAIAAMDENSMTNVTLVGCEPGFYYTLYGGPELADLSTTGTKYWSELCDADGTFAIPVVAKPSEAAGFFTIGVDAERPDNAGVAIVGTSVKSGKTVPGVRKVDFGGADGSSVSVWLENVKPKLAYGLGRSDVPQGPFVVEDGSWVMADEDGVLHKALTAPKVGPRNFYMIIVR